MNECISLLISIVNIFNASLVSSNDNRQLGKGIPKVCLVPGVNRVQYRHTYWYTGIVAVLIVLPSLVVLFYCHIALIASNHSVLCWSRTLPNICFVCPFYLQFGKLLFVSVIFNSQIADRSWLLWAFKKQYEFVAWLYLIIWLFKMCKFAM